MLERSETAISPRSGWHPVAAESSDEEDKGTQEEMPMLSQTQITPKPSIGRSLAEPTHSRESSPSDESSLIEGLKSGREESYELLVRRHGGRMLAVTLRMLRNEDDARDAVQEAFVSAFRGIHGFRNGCRLGTWLHRIAVNAALMRIRRQATHREVDLDELLPVFDATGHHTRPVPVLPPDGERRLLRNEARRHVRACIGVLPETHRSVLVLRDLEELDTAEVAGILGITPNAVKIRLHRARQAVAKLLSEQL